MIAGIGQLFLLHFHLILSQLSILLQQLKITTKLSIILSIQTYAQQFSQLKVILTKTIIQTDFWSRKVILFTWCSEGQPTWLMLFQMLIFHSFNSYLPKIKTIRILLVLIVVLH